MKKFAPFRVVERLIECRFRRIESYIFEYRKMKNRVKVMISPDRTSNPSSSAQLHAWVKAAYIHALEHYGPDHPLTKSWLAELRDLECFVVHLQR